MRTSGDERAPGDKTASAGFLGESSLAIGPISCFSTRTGCVRRTSSTTSRPSPEIEGGTCAWLVNLDSTGAAAEAALCIDERAAPEAYRKLLMGSSPGHGWLDELSRLACGSDTGEWAMYCEPDERDGRRRVPPAARVGTLQAGDGALSCGPASTEAIQEPALSYGFSAHGLSEKWRDEIMREVRDWWPLTPRVVGPAIRGAGRRGGAVSRAIIRRLLMASLGIAIAAPAGAQTGPAGTVHYYHRRSRWGSVPRGDRRTGQRRSRGTTTSRSATSRRARRIRASRGSTGHERDTETGMDYFGARYYMQRLGGSRPLIQCSIARRRRSIRNSGTATPTSSTTRSGSSIRTARAEPPRLPSVSLTSSCPR
jgi:hypothetical protein